MYFILLNGIPLNGFVPPHMCACPKPRTIFLSVNVVIIMFSMNWGERFVLLVLVKFFERHCLNSPFVFYLKKSLEIVRCVYYKEKLVMKNCSSNQRPFIHGVICGNFMILFVYWVIYMTLNLQNRFDFYSPITFKDR